MTILRRFVLSYASTAILCSAQGQSDFACLTGIVYYYCGSSQPYPTEKVSSEKCPTTEDAATRTCYWSERLSPRRNFDDCIIKRGGCSTKDRCGQEDAPLLDHEKITEDGCCTTADCNGDVNEDPPDPSGNDSPNPLPWVLVIVFSSMCVMSGFVICIVCLVISLARRRRKVEIHRSRVQMRMIAAVHRSRVVPRFVQVAQVVPHVSEAQIVTNANLDDVSSLPVASALVVQRFKAGRTVNV